MYIISQDREVVINTDNTTNIFIEKGTRITARMVDSEEVALGVYINGATEIFQKMLKECFSPQIIFTNVEPPEEIREKL